MAAALYSDFDYYANYPDTNGQFRGARMDFYNKDYDTNISLFQINPAYFEEYDISYRFNMKFVAKDWYTYDRHWSHVNWTALFIEPKG